MEKVWIRRGAKLDAVSGSWICRSCGQSVPADHVGLCPNVVEVNVATKQELLCDGEIGRVFDRAVVELHHRNKVLEICTESWAVPEYLRTAALKALKKETVKGQVISLWYNEIRSTIQHSAENCPPRPPLSKKAQDGRKGTLSQAVWR